MKNEEANRRKVILGAFYKFGGIPIPSVLIFPGRQRLPLCADTDFPSLLSKLLGSDIIYHTGLSVYSLWKNLFFPFLRGALSPDLTSPMIRKQKGNEDSKVIMSPVPLELSNAANPEGNRWKCWLCLVILLVAISLDYSCVEGWNTWIPLDVATLSLCCPTCALKLQKLFED